MARDMSPTLDRQQARIRDALTRLAPQREAAAAEVDAHTEALIAAVHVAEAVGVKHQRLASAARVYRPQLKTWLDKPFKRPKQLPTEAEAIAEVARLGAARAEARERLKEVTDSMAATARKGEKAKAKQTAMAEWAGVATSTVRVWLGLRKYNEGR